ncbi:MAG TPA: hypothetical protein VM052_03890 [Candidatus Limnocylindrales bacterium]|nr:hypothetical protein [Candidatus Limnocylindrales bacterium]
MQEALAKLDALMRRLVEADQTGRGIEPLRVADELGAIRSSLLQGQAVGPRAAGPRAAGDETGPRVPGPTSGPRTAGDERQFRCDACGTIAHGTAAPAACPTCGNAKFFEAGRESPVIDAGPG